ncbi:MAG: CehA/McbA family metallohydrolase [Thermodesulfobacteriota bacterium]|nr:CehA/McbA family metallohydrolase [Thermodesulfobacteriota bacterium]
MIKILKKKYCIFVIVCVYSFFSSIAYAENLKWYKGDLHSHSIHSDGDSSVAAVIIAVESLGFDFFALTDHDNDTNSQPAHLYDPDYRSETVTLLYGLEWITNERHASMWTATPFYYEKLWEANVYGDAKATIAEAHEQSALFWANQSAAYICYHWKDPFYEEIDSLEIRNSMYRTLDFNALAPGQIWDSILLSEKMMACVELSNSHHLREGQSILSVLGNPITWVYAEDKTAQAILDAIKAGHTSISYSPDAARLEFQADKDNDGIFETVLGDNLSGTQREVIFKILVVDQDETSIAENSYDVAELDTYAVEKLQLGLFTHEDAIQGLRVKNISNGITDNIRIAGMIKNDTLMRAWVLIGKSPVVTFTDTMKDLDYYRVMLYGQLDVDEQVDQLLYSKLLAITSPIYVGFYSSDISGDMKMYFGNLHSHTEYSDGQGTPREAFTWARDIAGYDFYAVTDHAEQILPREWNDIGKQADAFNDNGSFVALRGFEWSHSITGHINVFGTDRYTSSITRPTLRSFYRWLKRNNGLAQFNHPGREFLVFHYLAYKESVIDNIFAIETGNKRIGNNDSEYLEYYSKALDRGWRIAPTNNQDNHSLDSNTHRTVIIAPELSRVALLDAMRKRRIYSSDDPNIEVIFKYNEYWMGSEVLATGNRITFTIAVSDDEPIKRIELLNSDNSVVAEKILDVTIEKMQWYPEVSAVKGCYFAKITSENLFDDDDGKTEQVAVTAPIWVK